MDANKIKPGLRVKINHLNTTAQFYVLERYVQTRQAGLIGTVITSAQGHYDTWFILHTINGDVGVYLTEEFEHI